MDMVIVVGVFEGRIQRNRVETDVAFGFLGGEHRFLEGHFLGVVAAF